jgi:hypothetical protein
MPTVLSQFWSDERGSIPAGDWALLVAILVIAIVPYAVHVRHATDHHQPSRTMSLDKSIETAPAR